MPESVGDRVCKAHEDIIHLVKRPRYFTAVDEIREPHQPQSIARTRRAYNAGDRFSVGTPNTLNPEQFCNPLGRLPGSVWEIAAAPLVVPERVAHRRCCGGRKRPDCIEELDHYAAILPRSLPDACSAGPRPESAWSAAKAGAPLPSRSPSIRHPGHSISGRGAHGTVTALLHASARSSCGGSLAAHRRLCVRLHAVHRPPRAARQGLP